MNKEDKTFYWLIVLALIVVTAIMVFRAFRDYNDFRAHRAYFRQPPQEIKSWMPLGFVSKRYQISKEDLVRELKLSDFLLNEKLTIDKICEKNQLNCTQVVENLNSLARK